MFDTDPGVSEASSKTFNEEGSFKIRENNIGALRTEFISYMYSFKTNINVDFEVNYDGKGKIEKYEASYTGMVRKEDNKPHGFGRKIIKNDRIIEGSWDAGDEQGMIRTIWYDGSCSGTSQYYRGRPNIDDWF